MASPFQTEAWIEYGLGTAILFLRYFARWHAVGFKGWQWDDYFAVLTLVFWTLELTMLELIGQNGTNVGVTDAVGATLSDAEIASYEFGSKCLLAGWTFYVTLIWSLKASMLCFYNRITLGLQQQKIVKWTALACILAYLAVIAVIWGHCTPVHKNWQVVPYPGDQCTYSVANYLTLVVLNTTTDFALLCIPLPLLWKVQIPITRKLAIGVLLCSGIFIIVAAILRCVLSLESIEGINVSTIWAIRETFVGIIAVNAACIRPLFSKARWLSSNRGQSSNYRKYGGNSSGHALTTIGGGNSRVGDGSRAGNDGPPLASSRRRNKTLALTDLEDNSSEEHIVKEAQYANGNGTMSDIRAGSTLSGSSGGQHDGGIMVTTTYEVNNPNQKSTLNI